MKVNPIYTSNILKKGLKFAADNSALFAAGTTLFLSTAVRPLSILVTPKTNRENKEAACAKSIASSLTGYLLMYAVSKPFSRAISKINNEPRKYLKGTTINAFKKGSKSLSGSKSYMLATQIFKLGLGMIVAAPKAIVTAISVPIFMKMFNNKKQSVENKHGKNVSFSGLKDQVPKSIAKVLNNKRYQDFAIKFKDTNFPMHMVAATDIITTGTFVKSINKNTNVDIERKKPLIHNAVISTGLSILSGYFTDRLLDKPTEKFISKFKKINKNSKDLNKYIEGIKIAKPILIMGGLYYTLIPIVSTLLADRTSVRNIV